MKGRAIINDVLRVHGVSSDDFFGLGRMPQFTAARIEAAVRLDAAGLGVCAIARMMKRNHGTVSYWLRPDLRAARRDYYARYWTARRGEPAKRVTTPEQRAHLMELQKAREWEALRSLERQMGLSRGYTSSMAYKKTRKTGLPVLSPASRQHSVHA
jgi:hypothetical protein